MDSELELETERARALAHQVTRELDLALARARELVAVLAGEPGAAVVVLARAELVDLSAACQELALVVGQELAAQAAREPALTAAARERWGQAAQCAARAAAALASAVRGGAGKGAPG